MRIDRFLVKNSICSRSEAKKIVRSGRVSVNGKTLADPSVHIDEASDEICFDGQIIRYEKFRYYMLNKPQGIVSATEDTGCATVLDLFEGVNKKDLFPVGRLDKDTEGLLLITNDGKLAHELLSPKRHVDKKYYVETNRLLNDEDMRIFEEGVDIGDAKKTLPAKIEKITDQEKNAYYVTIREGRFHQIKRMFQAFGAGVTYLKRISMGGLVLDETLDPGDFRPLSSDEISLLYFL